MKILITGAMGAGAYQLKNKLSGNEIILGDFTEIPLPMLKSGSVISLPKITDASYVHLMLALCLDIQIGHIYTLNAEEYSMLSGARQLFAEYGIEISFAGNDKIQ